MVFNSVKNLLIIEDDPIFPTLIENVLGRRFVCTIASTYAAAVDALKKHTYDLVWCDLKLPDSHQDQTLPLVRGLAGTAAIVACTGVVDAVNTLHADAVARKPLNGPADIDRLADEAMANAEQKSKLERTADSVAAMTSAIIPPTP